MTNGYRSHQLDQIHESFISQLEELIAKKMIPDTLLNISEIREIFQSFEESGEQTSFLEQLVDQGHIKEKLLVKLISGVYRFGQIKDYIEILDNAFENLPKTFTIDFILENRFIPVAFINGELQFLTPEIPSKPLLDKLQKASNAKEMVPLICTFSTYYIKLGKLQEIYQIHLASQLDSLSDSAEGVDLSALTLQTDVKKLVQDEKVVEIVEKILLVGYLKEVSDIHIEPQKNEVVVRVRRDGVLYELYSLPKIIQNALIARIKILADLDITKNFEPQDGRISMRTVRRNGKPAIVTRNNKGEKGDELLQEFDLRVSTLRSLHGECVVMRLLVKKKKKVILEETGFNEKCLAAYRRLITASAGMVLVTGPTGSGKSSTLYGALEEINQPSRKIITVEDPVEYQLALVNQVQVNPERGLNFASTLRAMLRQDPEVIMVGEIRDAETGSIAAEAALTGHLVLSTLHSIDAPSTINRMINIGVPPFLLVPALTGVISQRLVRCICPYCKVEEYPDPEKLSDLGIDDREKLANKGVFQTGAGVDRAGKACKHCEGTGFKGRTALIEILVLNEEMRDLIYQRAPLTLLRGVALKANYEPIYYEGLKKAVQGITSIDEVHKVVRVPEGEKLPEEQYTLLNSMHNELIEDTEDLSINISGQDDIDIIFQKKYRSPKEVQERVKGISPEKVKILMVEDSRIYREVWKKFLNKHGFVNIEMAETGEEAMELAEAFQPDLLSIDYSLGSRMTGLDLLEDLKKTLPASTIYILMSAMCSKNIIFKAKNLEATHWVLKEGEMSLHIFLDTMITALEKKMHGDIEFGDLNTLRKRQWKEVDAVEQEL